MKLYRHLCPSCGVIFYTSELLTTIRCPRVLCTSWKVEKNDFEIHDVTVFPLKLKEAGK